MQCMIKPHERLIIGMMLVSEDNASRKKKRKVKKLHSALFYLPAGGLLLTHHNGVKVYFNKHAVWETGKLAPLATPGVTLLSQSLPTDTCSVIHRKASSSTLTRAVMLQQWWPWAPMGGKGQAWARCLFGKNSLLSGRSSNVCFFFSSYKPSLPSLWRFRCNRWPEWPSGLQGPYLPRWGSRGKGEAKICNGGRGRSLRTTQP